MKQLTADILKAVMPNASALQCKEYATLINKYAPEFGLTSDIQMAHYLAQIAHESAQLHYTTEIASGKAYEGRKDLGNVHPGDGMLYKGRGLIQITGRANYKAYNDYLVGKGMQVDLLKTPELLARPLGATKSSLWFCQKHMVFQRAGKDTGRMTTVLVRDNGVQKHVTVNEALIGITKVINGGYNGIDLRQIYLDRAKRALGLV